MDDETPETELSDLKFEEGSYTLPELLESHLLPVVVQYELDEQPLPFEEFDFDFSQPLLLYKKRNIQKVSAKSLYAQNGRYEEVGESLLIPEDYKGWFSVLPRVAGLSGIDHGVPHYSTVEELANSNSERFLIGGTKRLTGLQINDMAAGHLDHSERHLFPGDVLTREKIYYGETKKKTRLFRKPKYIIEKFLMCRDEMEKEVLLPFEQQGIFYQVSHNGGKAQKNVLQMSDIVARKMTPRLIKLVYGRFPITPCAFSGLMRAESSDIEMSVIACTLVNTKNVLLELPVSSSMTFRVALTDDSLRLNTCYRNAISVCAERANTYMRNIKVCVDFAVEDDSETVPDDFIAKRNRSNSFDIDSIQPRQSRENVNSIKKSYGSLKRPSGYRIADVSTNSARDLRLSESLSSSVNRRPARSFSTGHMSFCLGNNYLTVPVANTGIQQKRNSGNNNSVHQTTTKPGQVITSGETFVEEEVTDNNKSNGTGLTVDKEIVESVPLPMPCTSVISYTNVNVTPDSETSNYATAWGTFRPVTKAPNIAPPPVPDVDSSKQVIDTTPRPHTIGRSDNRDEFEYAVPKVTEPCMSTFLSAKDNAGVSQCQKPVARRPSTFTFSEGCLGSSNRIATLKSVAQQDNEEEFEDDCPIYENIKTLMEAVSAKERILENANEGCEQTITEEPRSQIEPGNSTDDESHGVCSAKGFVEELKIIEHGDVEGNLPVINVNVDLDKYLIDVDALRNKPENTTTIREESNRYTGEYDDIANYAYTGEQNNTEQNNASDERNNEFVERIKPSDEENVVFVEASNASGIVNSAVESLTSHSIENEEVKIVDDAVSRSINELDDIMLQLHNECNIRNKVISAPKNSENPLQSNSRKTMERERQTISPQISNHEEDIRFMSTETVVENLRLVGVKESTVQKLTELNIDGSRLCEVLDGAVTLTKCLEGINLIDQQKISMFIRGWRPDMDYIVSNP